MSRKVKSSYNICEWCKKNFFSEKGWAKFCSSRCCSDNWKKTLKERDPEKYKRYREHSSKKAMEKVRVKNGIPLDTPKLNPNRGQGFKMTDGYKLLRNKTHPNSSKDGYVFEHIVNMSNHIGRPLKKGENVHHKNGIRHDNRIENLELWSSSQPPGQRVEDKIEWCKEFLDLYAYDVLKRN